MPSVAAAVHVDPRFFVNRRWGARAAPLVTGSRTTGGAIVHDAAGDPTDALARPGMPASPSRRLVAAVMWQALVDVGAVANAAPRLGTAAQAAAWFASDDAVWPYSFVNCCAALELEPGAVRHALTTGEAGMRRALAVRRART